MSVPADQMQAMLAVDQGISAANQAVNPNEAPPPEQEEVKRLHDEYKEARAFDEEARKQYNIDRRYAQGTADKTWVSNANLIGTFIRILEALIYAQDPDLNCRPAPQAGQVGMDPIQAAALAQRQKQRADFAETLQIVISRLWRDGRLKRSMRRTVRSALTVGAGWLKVMIYDTKKRNPQVEKQLNDARDNLAQIQAIQTKLREEDADMDVTDYEQRQIELQRQIAGFEANVEILVKRGLCIDFMRAEDVQISLDVAETTDYLDADWISHDMYVRTDQLRTRFPQLTELDIKMATVYHQRKPTMMNQAQMEEDTPTAEGAYTTGNTNVLVVGDAAVSFGKIVELWDHRDNMIKTFVEGTKRWAVEPFPPPQASSRFYSFFRLALFDADGARHPQSAPQRGKKLQDEYASIRSSGLLTKQRSVPGTIFHKGELSEEDVGRIQNSTQMEMVGVQTTTPDVDLNKIIVGKPVPRVDPMMFDTTQCERDMATVFGIQPAQRTNVSGVTATEANIQQSGLETNNEADRDNVEALLNDMALYTAEIAVASLEPDMVQRIAGPLAFWPHGMDPQDILMMLDVEIKAGTTGKPNARSDKETWATLLPLIQELMTTIQQLEVSNPLLAQGYKNLLRETLRRLDDSLTLEMIMPPTLPVAPPAVPGAPGAPGAPPVGNGTVNNSAAQGGPPIVEEPASAGVPLA